MSERRTNIRKCSNDVWTKLQELLIISNCAIEIAALPLVDCPVE
jgi:hypothetical protein